jgi:hypothetical protein
VSDRRRRRDSPFIAAVRVDSAIAIDPIAAELWLKDLENPMRWVLRPLLQFLLAVLLHITWFLKRLPLPQFRAHRTLQWTICWFCKYCVSPEANQLILRHFWTESNILNFLRDNSGAHDVPPLELYPITIDDMHRHTFVAHDQELFRLMHGIGGWEGSRAPGAPLDWTHWRALPTELPAGQPKKRWSQVFDFETSHALFMCLFCFLLTAEEYRDAINGFNLDQSIAIRAGKLIGDPTLAELAYNKYPHYLVGPWNLTQRFLMHGFFTEYMYARLEAVRTGWSESTTVLEAAGAP